MQAEAQESSFVRQAWGSVRTAVVASSAAIVIAVGVLMLSIFSAANPVAVSPHESVGTVGLVVGVKNDYYLPYPGMLPDNPLYKLKAVRDRVKLWLARDEEGKARLELLYADKRINAAKALVEGGRNDLGVSTATKAEKYLAGSCDRALKMVGGGRDVKSLLLTLAKATDKHAETLEELKGGVGGRVEVLEMARKETLMWHQKVEQALVEAK